MIDLPFVNHGRGQIDLSGCCWTQPIELQSTSIHLKENGTINDTPSPTVTPTRFPSSARSRWRPWRTPWRKLATT